MSLTNADLIADSLRELSVISEVQTPSAEQFSLGLRKLNQMMAKWLEDGIEIGFYPQTLSSDICPIPDYAELGVTLALAVHAASNFGATAGPELIATGTSAFETILRTSISQRLPVGRMMNRPQGTGDTRNLVNILLG